MSVTGESTRQALHRRLMKILKNTADAEETAQEAQLKFHLSERAREADDPIAYLFGIATNKAYELLGRRRRARVAFDSEAAERGMEVLSTKQIEDPVSAQLFNEQQLEEIVREMPDGPRQVLILSYCAGLSPAEIAKRLQLSPATVKTYLARARAHARGLQWD